MADVTVNASVAGGTELTYGDGRLTATKTEDIIYAFGTDTAAGNTQTFYVKSADGGATWGSRVDIIASTAGAEVHISIWADWWTPGISTTVIHIALMRADNDDVQHFTLETATDTLAGPNTIFAGVTQTTAVFHSISVTKSRGGNLYCAFDIDGGTETGFYRSTDGSTWAARDNSINEGAADIYHLFPGGDADNQDIWAAFWDTSAEEISLKVHDDSANTWAETSIATTMNDAAATSVNSQMAGAIRHSDNHLILVAWNDFDLTTSDLMCWDINGAASITAKTNVVTNSDDCIGAAVLIDKNNDAIYVAYMGKSDGSQTAGTSVGVYYKKSADGAGTWGSETTIAETLGDYSAISLDMGGLNTRVLPIWFDDANIALQTNTVNSVKIVLAIPVRGELFDRGQSSFVGSMMR